MKMVDIVEDLGKGLVKEQLAQKGEKQHGKDRKEKELRPGKPGERDTTKR